MRCGRTTATDWATITCHRDRLRPLFFSGLNNPNSRDLTEGLRTVIGDVPFLNGGLFEETQLDKRNGITVPDEAVRQVLTGLLTAHVSKRHLLGSSPSVSP